MRHVKVRIGHSVLRALNLNVSSGAERDMLTFRHPQLQLFNKGGFVIIRDNLALPFLTPKISSGSSIFMFWRTATLAGQTTALFCLTLCDMRQLGWQNIATALFTVTRHCPQEPPPPQAEETKCRYRRAC